MFDGDVLAVHDDTLDEQAHQLLPAGEVEGVEALAHGSGEGVQLRL